jgi:hypothetical protein
MADLVDGRLSIVYAANSLFSDEPMEFFQTGKAHQ